MIGCLFEMESIPRHIVQGTPWDVSMARFNNVSLSIAPEDTSPEDLTFHPDGTRMFVVGSNDDAVVEYDLVVPWDVSTASYNGATQEFSVGNQERVPTDVVFSTDGLRMFVVGVDGDAVVEYDLAVPWDVSTASYNGAAQEFSVRNQERVPTGLVFRPDGTRMFVVGWNDYAVVEYDLAVPWDVSTAVYNGAAQEFFVGGQETSPSSLAFQSDGTRMFVVGWEGDAVVEYDLVVPWDVSTAVYNGEVEEFSVAAQDGSPQGLAFQSDGTRMFMIGLGSDRVWEYDLVTFNFMRHGKRFQNGTEQRMRF